MRILLAAWALLLAVPVMAAEKSFPLHEQGSFVIDVPEAWNVQAQGTERMPPTLNFTPKMGESFHILVTPVWAMGRALPDPESIRGFVMKAAESAGKEAVEKTIDVKELKGDAVRGFYFSSTDKAPKPNSYRHLTQGIYRVGSLMVTFSVLTNDGQGAVVERALAMFRKSLHKPGNAAR